MTELVRKFPDSCLHIKIFSQTADKSSTSSSEITSHITERSRALTSSELLVLVGEVGAGQQQRYLRCLDSRDDNVYQPMDMQAKFSAFTKEDMQPPRHQRSPSHPLAQQAATADRPDGVRQSADRAKNRPDFVL